jgi:photosystem II stability/assembly factor-like uncharacterized protein
VTSVRVLVGTRKGAFILTSDGQRNDWHVDGPHFPGWEIYHLKGSPVDPNRIYASQSSGWFGQVVHRSDDGGASWNPVGNRFGYEGEPGTHLFYDGTPRPFEFKRVWHFEPSLSEVDTVYAGVEDAAIFRSTDGGKEWNELPSLRQHRTAPAWQPGAGGMCLHTILLDPTNPDRIYTAISAAGAFRTDDAGDSWREISGNLPTDFGFAIDVHAHEPETVYVIPITSDSQHFPLNGQLRVWRSRTGGDEWQPLTQGLPQSHCYVDVLRDAMSVDLLDECGIYFGTTGGQVYSSADSGDTWSAIVNDLPAVLSVEVQTLS